ncbi:hypothetical protein, conserved [Leishmania tarentolae]|uniref:Uncharacterized protein n=1 Tax=Leishmania tarentolae TaxID=5689 RepID=A0A640KLU2_LEITA|nr:hypothetical protein, conserved [Leishmania tarentolae]
MRILSSIALPARFGQLTLSLYTTSSNSPTIPLGWPQQHAQQHLKGSPHVAVCALPSTFACMLSQGTCIIPTTMNSHNRNIAIASSTAYGVMLCAGMLFFLLDTREKPFCMHPSSSVAVFSVFWFSFAPSVLFIGATIPWLCAAYDSEVAVLVFALVPGLIFGLLGVLWIVVYLFHERDPHFLEAQQNALWGGNVANLGVAHGDSVTHRHLYTAADPAVVGGVETFSVANGALPRTYGVWTPNTAACGLGNVDAANMPASQWRGYNSSDEKNILRDAGEWSADQASSASWYRRPISFSTPSIGQLEPPSLAQEHQLGAH